VIGPDDRVATVLAHDARLLDVLVAASPTFEKLRNPLARKTMARLVTVAQAARIAGIDAGELVARLNAALGVSVPEGASAPAAPSPAPPQAAVPPELVAIPHDRIVDLDVRDDLRAGREPLRRILDTVRALPPDAVLRLRATFEPVPLYAVLAKQGLAHHTERLGDEDWRVWFHRGLTHMPAEPRDRVPTPTAGDAAVAEDDDVVVLDVRDLEPPEPMERTLEALATLAPGKTLVQLNVRVPQFLLPRLEERGFTYEIRQQSADLVRLFIRHRHP